MLKMPNFPPDNQYGMFATPIKCVTYLGGAGICASAYLHSFAVFGVSFGVPCVFYAWSCWVGQKIIRGNPDKPQGPGAQILSKPRKARNKKSAIDAKRDEKSNMASKYTKHILEEDNWIDELLLECNEEKDYASMKIKTSYNDIDNLRKSKSLIAIDESNNVQLINSDDLVNTYDISGSMTFSLN